ncbi:MAG: aminotransferase class I/II-fold pyridoxal phosphate-dependent enzyme [Verrucomicrobia bacterium]|nr:aminotransferase class I/II-fold pyridoxal phosphate-dependent enzyme [Verrucomicrobiota bacterium]
MKSPIARHLIGVPRSGIRDFFEIVSARKGVISLGIGEPDFVTPWHISEAALFALERGATAYTSNLGILELREEVARYMERFYKVSYDPKTEILITVGVSEALDLAIRALIQPGDEVLYHEPCYVSYAPVVTFAHGKAVAVSTRREDDFRLTRAALEAKVSPRTKVLLLNFPTNPTGAVLPRKDCEEIAAFAIEHDLVVLTDEIYAELTYAGGHVSIASLPGMKERTIFLNGFSKTWAMTGWRIGFACAPPELTEAMMKIHQYTIMCAPTLGQKAAIEALRHGEADAEHMRKDYEKRRNYICASLEEMGIPCHLPKGAFYAFPYIGHFGLSSKDFALNLLDQENVACVPGTAFGSSGEGFIRCAYAANMPNIKEAMSRMARFVGKLRK